MIMATVIVTAIALQRGDQVTWGSVVWTVINVETCPSTDGRVLLLIDNGGERPNSRRTIRPWPGDTFQRVVRPAESTTDR